MIFELIFIISTYHAAESDVIRRQLALAGVIL